MRRGRGRGVSEKGAWEWCEKGGGSLSTWIDMQLYTKPYFLSPLK